MVYDVLLCSPGVIPSPSAGLPRSTAGTVAVSLPGRVDPAPHCAEGAGPIGPISSVNLASPSEEYVVGGITRWPALRVSACTPVELCLRGANALHGGDLARITWIEPDSPVAYVTSVRVQAWDEWLTVVRHGSQIGLLGGDFAVGACPAARRWQPL